jgi:hypothetical protein
LEKMLTSCGRVDCSEELFDREQIARVDNRSVLVS